MIENKTLQRYEFKYFLSSKISKEIKDHIKKFMILDKFANKNLNKCYFVRSIYFDDNINSNFEEKINGHRIRKKFRIRFYNKNIDNSPIYLETKGRNLERTYKRRIKIDQEDFQVISTGNSVNYLLSKYPNSLPIKEFIFEYNKK